MDYDDIKFKLNGYLEDQNYVAACLYLKTDDIPEDTRHEMAGEIAKHVVSGLASEKNKEKILYLRSILLWLFKDIPGLASVYREQLRLASDSPNMVRDFLRGVRTFADVTTGGGSEAFGEKVDEAAENLKPDFIHEKVKDFFSDAGLDVDDGIKKARDFFDSLAGRGQTKPKPDASDADKEPDDTEAP